MLRTEPDGRITAGGVLFGRANRLAKFARHVIRRVDRRARLKIAIGHSLCEDDARTLRQHLLGGFDDVESARIADLGTAFGVHGGPGTLVVALQHYSRTTDSG